MQKGYTARLYPSKEQLNILNKAFGATRFVYNYFLAERIRSYKEDGVSLTYNKTANMLTTLKRDKDHLWLLISIHAPHEGERQQDADDVAAATDISIHAPHEGERLY